MNTIKVGPEFRVNTYTEGSQNHPSVAALADGGFVATWSSYEQDGSGSSIYGQRYDAVGNPVGGEFRANTYNHSEQYFPHPSVAGLADGGFVATWSSYEQDGSGYGIYGQHYDAAGNRVGGEFRVNTYTQGHQHVSSVAALADGGFVATWDSSKQDGSLFGIYGQRYDAAGNRVGGEFRANTYTQNSQHVQSRSVAALADGGFVATWTSNGQDGSSYGIYGQRYNAAGNRVGGEFRANTYTRESQWAPSVAGLADGGFVATWSSYGQDGSSYGIYGQRYNAAGNRVGGEFRANTYTQGHQNVPLVAALADGGFVATWSSYGQDGSSSGVYGQRYNAAGNRVGALSPLGPPTGKMGAVLASTGNASAPTGRSPSP